MLKFRPAGLLMAVLLLACSRPLVAQTVPFDALLRGGRIHYDGQRFERAREQFQKALDQYGATIDNVALAQVHTWLGLSEAQLKNYPAASDHFVIALEKDSAVGARIRANEQWQYHASAALLSTTRDSYFAGSYEPALRYALAAVKVDPSKTAVYSLVANIYSQLGRFEEMRRTADDLLKLDARSAEAYGLLGLYFLQKPDSLWPDKAARDARWDSAAAYSDLAIAVYTERFAKARTDLAALLKLADSTKVDVHVWQLINLSRGVNSQVALKTYIEGTLKAQKQLVDIAGVAGRLHAAANNLNTANARAGSAMLQAAAQTADSMSERFRRKAEAYFGRAVAYDSGDFTAMFDLGIALYQGKNDSGAERSLSQVTRGSCFQLSELPPALQDSLVGLITADARKTGSLELTGSLAAAVDSCASALGKRGIGYTWFYFVDQKDRTDAPTPADRAAMFVSAQQPELLEQAFLWLGSSQTGMGTTLTTTPQNDAARAKYRQAVDNLVMATKLNPNSADAYQNLGICYRELGDKQKALTAFEKADKIRKGN